MIRIKTIYIGNKSESYIQGGFTDGVNIITSEDNHVGKTIVMQSIMFALGADAKFPPSFKHAQYLFIVDIDIDGHEVSILRNKDYFVIKDGDAITAIEGKGSFDEYWNENISELPTIIKDGSSIRAGLPLYTQMAFVPQADRSTSNTLGSFFNKNDFVEMIFALQNLDARQMDNRMERALKHRRDELRTREKELSKQAKILKQVGTSLAVVSPTADREEMKYFITELDGLKNEITSLKKQRNHAYTRMKKNESVLEELRSLNREMRVGSVICMDCGSEAIGYKMPGSDFAFDITTDDMRRQILQTVQDRIDAYRAEISALDDQIRRAQRHFDSVAETREITLEDVFVAREDYVGIEGIDAQLTDIRDEIDDIAERLKEARRVDKELAEDRADFKSTLVETMNAIRRNLNDDPGALEYDDLFTKANNPYIGSEATEFFLARAYSLAAHIDHGLPILIDSFRAEELSTSREERALPFFVDLPNQVIFTATLKGQEVGKYHDKDGINNIDYTGYAVNKLLSEADNDTFQVHAKSFGIILNG